MEDKARQHLLRQSDNQSGGNREETPRSKSAEARTPYLSAKEGEESHPVDWTPTRMPRSVRLSLTKRPPGL